jgi:hypothetical protein
LPSRSAEVGLSGLACGGSRTPELSAVTLIGVAFVLLLRRGSVGLSILLAAGCHHGGRRVSVSSVAVTGAWCPESGEVSEAFEPGEIVAEQVGEVLHRVKSNVKTLGDVDTAFQNRFRLKKIRL